MLDQIIARLERAAKIQEDPVTPAMVESIMTWFDGKFMKGGGFGLTPAHIKEIRKFTPLSTPPKKTKIYRATIKPIPPEVPFKIFPGVLKRKEGKPINLVKSANTLKSWTDSLRTADNFYMDNFHTNRRGKGKYALLMEAKFDKSEYVTDIDSLVKLLKKNYPAQSHHLKVNYLAQREIIMFMKPQQALIKKTYIALGK